MKVLVLFEYANHYQTIDNLCKHLNIKGVDASSFNLTYWRFRRGSTGHRVLWIRLVCALAVLPGVRGLMSTLFRDRALRRLSRSFDAVDIHFFSPKYDRLIEALGRRHKPVKITIWGSDFFKATEVRREKQRELYQKVRVVQLETREIAGEFLKVYPELEDRVRIAHFGIVQLEIIDELLGLWTREHYRKELEVPVQRMVLTCGTNRSKGHRHLKILESIGRLEPGLREQLYLVFPMTYGGDRALIQLVREKARSLGVPFRILGSFLSLEDLCKYRIISDITLTIQESDALASAIQEHLYTEEVLIAGDWLPYQVLKDHGVFYLTTSLESLDEVLADAIANHAAWRDKCAGNRGRIAGFSGWDHVIGDWLDIYRALVPDMEPSL